MMKATYKYTQQGRYFLGVAEVRLAIGSIKGVGYRVFDYSMRRIISIKDFAKAIKEESSRVKELSCKTLTLPWTVSNTPEGYNSVHEDDPVTQLIRVGTGTAQKLATAGITKVKNIKMLILEQHAHLKANNKVSEIFKIFSFAQDNVPRYNP